MDNQIEKLLIEAREKLIAAGYNPEAVVGLGPRDFEIERWIEIVTAAQVRTRRTSQRSAALRSLMHLYLKITEP
jgi:hypothetical protein